MSTRCMCGKTGDKALTIDEHPHQILMYTLLFSLFHYFLYIIDPPLCTPAPTWLHLFHWTDLTLMSILIRYSHIPFYFCFSITSSTSSIYHYAPPHWSDCTHFIRPISFIWWTHVLQFTCFISILSIPNVHPPAVWPIMNPCTTWSGTYYSFTLDEPYAHFLVDHSYLTFLYLTFKTITIAHTSFPQNSDPALMPCIAPHSPHTIFHHITLPHSPTTLTYYTTPGDDPLPPDHTLRAT